MAKNIRIGFLVFSLSLSGCANLLAPNPSEFYGIRMHDISDARELNITEYSLENGVKYSYSKSSMDPSVSAFADLNRTGIKISVTNKSSAPINTNYFLDSFLMNTKDGKTYVLEKGDILDYPKVDYINPGSTAHFNVKLPFKLFGLKKDDVSMLLCSLGKDANIVLVPLPDPPITEN